MASNELQTLFIVTPLFAIGVILFGLASSACFAAWVYSDSRRRGEDGIAWAVAVFVATPFIGLPIYLFKRLITKMLRPDCGCTIPCGAPEGAARRGRFKFILSGILSAVLMTGCLAGFITGIVSGPASASFSSGGGSWSRSYVVMQYQTHLNGVWKLSLHKASRGYMASSSFLLEDPDSQALYADILCDAGPEDASLTLRLTQGEKSVSTDVTSLEAPLLLPLTGFARGEIRAELEINGVENVKSEMYIR